MGWCELSRREQDGRLVHCRVLPRLAALPLDTGSQLQLPTVNSRRHFV